MVPTVSETSRLALVEWLADESINVGKYRGPIVVYERSSPGGPTDPADAGPYLLYVGAYRSA